jgi:predicted NBD/HSP70 family sugar kinase
VVLALPVALDSVGLAQPSTYPGLYGPVEPLFSELFECPWVVVNDAVLAAVGFRPETREKTLVVTLGFGLGGALWHG